ncbi:MAG: GMC family oxidoreductase [Pseudolabrys sp.]
MDKRFDVIIVGSGAGGGTLARSLAPSGKNILILERGDWLKREADNWDAAAVFEYNRYVSPDTWYDRNGRPFQPQVHYFVGGATKLFGAALYRLRQRDFAELRHYDGISPAWPISYEEFEPYYARAEEMYHVHGLRGHDPTEPPSSGPYPCPPVSDEPRISQLRDRLIAVGYHPFNAPCAIMLNEANMAYSTCIRCKTCDGFPCLVHAKSDAEIVAVRPALEFPNVTLMRNAKAVKLETNAAGTAVTEVIAEVEGERDVFRGDVVILSCGALNTAKLLLMSANDRHPNGLANGSGQVGRNYMFHNSQAVLAISLEPNPTIFQKTLALNDFYFGMEGFEYPMGNIQMLGKSFGPMYRGEKPLETALLPMGLLDNLADHAVDFWLTTEDLPNPENRVTVDRSGKVTLTYTPNNQVPTRKLYDQLKSMLSHLRMHPDHLIPRNVYMKNAIPIAGCAHQAGTCRFGSDAKTSVLDRNCKTHELDNLYVSSASGR